MSQSMFENAKASGGVAVGAGAITWTHLFWVPLEHWILWLTFIVSAFWAWGQVKAHVVAPLKARWPAIRKWLLGVQAWWIRRRTKKRRATDL